MRNEARYRGNRGRSLVESLALGVVLAVMLAVAVPSLVETRKSAALAGAAGKIRGMMFRCRVAAVMRQRSTGLVFERRAGSVWRCFIALDGDGDGIRRRDIENGADEIVSEILAFAPREAGLGILVGEAVPDPSGRGLLRGCLDDPIRAGRGDIITFTPQGHATPSSVYFTDHRSKMRVLRVYGATGRVVCLRWQKGWRQWRRGLY